MPSIVTPTELAIKLDYPDNTMLSDRGNQELDSAEAAVMAEIGWYPVQSTRTYTISEPTWAVVLPALNVTALAVTVSGNPYTTLTWTSHGIVRFNSLISSGTITYTAGWPLAELAGIKGVILDMAASKFDNPRGLRTKAWQLGDESESETYMGSTAENPLRSDPRLAPYRLAVLA